MIVLSPVEILALAAVKNHAPGIRTRAGVLDENSWRGNPDLGPLPTAADIAAAVAAYRPVKDRMVEIEDRLAALEPKIAALEGKDAAAPAKG